MEGTRKYNVWTNREKKSFFSFFFLGKDELDYG